MGHTSPACILLRAGTYLLIEELSACRSLVWSLYGVLFVHITVVPKCDRNVTVNDSHDSLLHRDRPMPCAYKFAISFQSHWLVLYSLAGKDLPCPVVNERLEQTLLPNTRSFTPTPIGGEEVQQPTN